MFLVSNVVGALQRFEVMVFDVVLALPGYHDFRTHKRVVGVVNTVVVVAALLEVRRRWDMLLGHQQDCLCSPTFALLTASDLRLYRLNSRARNVLWPYVFWQVSMLPPRSFSGFRSFLDIDVYRC